MKGMLMSSERIEQKRRVRGPSHRPIPDDFAEHARREGDIKLKRRYRVGQAVILRWRKASGLYCGQPRGPRKVRTFTRGTPVPKKRYHSFAMSEKLSWYDAEDDIGSLIDIPRDERF
jgi:hypothetical protein